MIKSYPFDQARQKKRQRELLILMLLGPVGAFLGSTKFGSEPFDRLGLISTLLAVLIFGGLYLFLLRVAKAARKQRVEIDYDNGLVRFLGYTFVTKFVGNKERDIVEVPFNGIFKVATRDAKGTLVADLSTEQGPVSVSDLENLDDLIASLEEIANVNREHNSDFLSESIAAPKPTTPWYGWLILAAGIAAVAYIGWLGLYKN